MFNEIGVFINNGVYKNGVFIKSGVDVFIKSGVCTESCVFN